MQYLSVRISVGSSSYWYYKQLCLCQTIQVFRRKIEPVSHWSSFDEKNGNCTLLCVHTHNIQLCEWTEMPSLIHIGAIYTVEMFLQYFNFQCNLMAANTPSISLDLYLKPFSFCYKATNAALSLPLWGHSSKTFSQSETWKSFFAISWQCTNKWHIEQIP